MKNYTKYIEDHTVRCEASYRGGGIEIDLEDLLNYNGAKMTAYQNYLGGGMLGAIGSSQNFNPLLLGKKNRRLYEEIKEELKKYFHELTNHEDDEWSKATYEQNQSRPMSAY